MHHLFLQNFLQLFFEHRICTLFTVVIDRCMARIFRILKTDICGYVFPTWNLMLFQNMLVTIRLCGGCGRAWSYYVTRTFLWLNAFKVANISQIERLFNKCCPLSMIACQNCIFWGWGRVWLYYVRSIYLRLMFENRTRYSQNYIKCKCFFDYE